MNNLNNQTEEELDTQQITELSSFFDLLAKYDYDDKQKEKLALNSDSLVSAPRASEFGSNFQE